ncbi:hypothetical protein KAN5_24250 [Pseudoalteromonas sp. KAN5]|nr:hypothetical protein KAN5_24250 [Pseudoalteromonas sp. KAN5]
MNDVMELSSMLKLFGAKALSYGRRCVVVLWEQALAVNDVMELSSMLKLFGAKALSYGRRCVLLCVNRL